MRYFRPFINISYHTENVKKALGSNDEKSEIMRYAGSIHGILKEKNHEYEKLQTGKSYHPNRKPRSSHGTG